MTGSLSRRLSVSLSSLIVVTGVLAALMSYVLTAQQANALQDAHLQQIAALFAERPLSSSFGVYTPKDEEDAETHLVIKRLGLRPQDADRRVDLDLPQTLPTGLQTIEAAGYTWRVCVARDVQGTGFAVAERMTVRDEEASDAAWNALAPSILLVPLLLLLVRWAVRRSLSPLRQLARQVDDANLEALATLDVSGVPREVLPLAEAMNRTLVRLGAALSMQRRFIADAAHELRTPVGALMVQADNLGRADGLPSTRDRLSSLRSGLARMAALLEQLLSLARLQGTAPAPPVELQLDDIVRLAIEDALPHARAKSIDLGCVLIAPTTVWGTQLQWHAIVSNALDNALRYTPDGGVVDVSVSRVGHTVLYIVDDSGPGLAATDVERVFEPFVRLLGTEQTGSGLGLTIARTAAAALGGTISLVDRPDGKPGLRFMSSFDDAVRAGSDTGDATADTRRG